MVIMIKNKFFKIIILLMMLVLPFLMWWGIGFVTGWVLDLVLTNVEVNRSLIETIGMVIGAISGICTSLFVAVGIFKSK